MRSLPDDPKKGPFGVNYGWWVVISIVYIISPIDLLPDIIPIVGWTDDTGMFGFGIYSFIRWLKSRSSP